MKIITAVIVGLFSLNVLAADYKVQDVLCSNFDYYRAQKMCLLVIKNDTEKAAIVLDQRIVLAKVADEKLLIGKRLSTNLNSLLMLTFDEEESIRNYINHPNASYYSASARDIKFLDL